MCETKTTIDSLLNLVQADLSTQGRASLRTYPSQVKHLRRHLGGVAASKVGYLRLQKFKQARLEEGAAPKTVNNELAWCLRGFKLGVRAELVKSVPECDKLTLDNVRTGFVDIEGLGRICSELRKRCDAVVADATELAFHTGMRRREVATLRWSDVDSDWVTIRPANEKARRGRKFPLTKQVKKIIMRRLATQKGEFIFHRAGRELPEFSPQFRTATRKAGLPGIRLHDMRRSFVRQLIRKGVQQKIVMQLVGHSTPSMLDRYNIVDDADLNQAAQVMG